MNIISRWLLLLLIFTGGLHSAIAADAAATRKTLESCYRRMDHAAARLDVHGYLAFAAPDLIAVSDGETFPNRAGFEKHLSEEFNATRKMYTFASTINRFAAEDDAASIDLTTHLVADTVDTEGQYGAKGLIHHVDIQMNFHNEWKHSEGHWHLVRFASTGVSGTMDGKAIPSEK